MEEKTTSRRRRKPTVEAPLSSVAAAGRDEHSDQTADITSNLDDFSRLDLFALVASIAIAQRMTDPVRIAHESYAVAREMVKLSKVLGIVKTEPINPYP